MSRIFLATACGLYLAGAGLALPQSNSPMNNSMSNTNGMAMSHNNSMSGNAQGGMSHDDMKSGGRARIGMPPISKSSPPCARATARGACRYPLFTSSRPDGVIAWRFADVDFAHRPEPDEILAALERL